MKDLEKVHKERKEAHLWRSLDWSMHEKIDFCSNDYLGYSRLMQSGRITPPVFLSGSTGSRLISGHTRAHEETENKLAQYFNFPSALLFPSGYQANLGLISAFSDRNTIAICDEYVHASIQDGIVLGRAKRLKFRHNDLSDLELKLQNNIETDVLVIIESLYSMTGRSAPVDDLLKLKQKYSFRLIVDEAHAVGILGDERKGLCNYSDENVIKVITFGKAFGYAGAAVLSSELVRNHLINYCRPFIYSTAMPVNDALTIGRIIDFHAQHFTSNHALNEIIEVYKKRVDLIVQPYNFTKNEGPIQYIYVDNLEKLMALNQNFDAGKLAIRAIRPPTVPAHSSGFRVCLHAFNTPDEIDELFSEKHWRD